MKHVIRAAFSDKLELIDVTQHTPLLGKNRLYKHTHSVASTYTHYCKHQVQFSSTFSDYCTLRWILGLSTVIIQVHSLKLDCILCTCVAFKSGVQMFFRLRS